VEWLAPVAERNQHLIYGYFIQDFEPYFYPPFSADYKAAWKSYGRFPGLVHLATTAWVRAEVQRQVKVECKLVGPPFDVNLFRPRPRAVEWPQRPLRIAAMIRPGTPRRGPHFTMDVMRRIDRTYGKRVEIRLFGTEADRPDFLALPRDFRFSLAGTLYRNQMVSFINEMDIFADLSMYQALGLTSLEAMACGVACVVPLTGGASSFARDGANCLVADTSSEESCVDALRRLIEDDALRARLQKQGIFDACEFYIEGPALRIAAGLFGDGGY
jgi:glycosyltransferase involved in cell wall biosynthesis